MKLTEVSDFEQANQKIHKVEDEWHYGILTKYGWTPIDEEGIGFVRGYKYIHPDHPHVVVSGNTGSNSDYWTARDGETRIGGGYSRELEPFLQSLKKSN